VYRSPDRHFVAVARQSNACSLARLARPRLASYYAVQRCSRWRGGLF